MLERNHLLILLLLWGVPFTYFRSLFRKKVYQTNDWKINIKPLFLREIKALFVNLYPEDRSFNRLRFFYLFYLIVYLGLAYFYFTWHL